MAHLGDDLGHAVAAAVQRYDHIQLVQTGQRNQRIAAEQTLAFQQGLAAGIALNDIRLRQLLGQHQAALGIVFDDLHLNAAFQQQLRQIIADAPAAADQHTVHLAGDDAQILQQPGKVVAFRGDKDLIPLAQHKVAGGHNALAAAGHGAHQHLAVHGIHQIVQRHIAQLAAGLHAQLHNFHAALGKGLTL